MEIVSEKKIIDLMKHNVGKFCDYKTKEGFEGSGVIRKGQTEFWIAYGNKDECCVDSSEILLIENITD